ncbi:STAS domain-containing protein [Alkalimonas amylolytica]|uniref:Phospholipid transport system transporter-binding protein n=1 Tax=Alkalimonas amylolytica TaxID=152573 RepID=A0A1H3YDT1_ALKAM|nr:STAS domain-containing protein [Alkalimonas amylolytica]SEA09092.1 phospholipid transport system transporter-binding protein [Alkalimonas amylolytica]
MLNIEQQQQRLLFSGVLDRNTLLAFWPFRLLNSLSGDVVFDLSQLQSIDTAGLAWLLKQLALARQAGLVVQLQHVPEQMRSLAKVSDVLELLPISD